MPLTIEDVITPTTAAEIEAEVLSLCATAQLPTSSWQSGSVIRTFIAIVSEVIYQKSLVETEIAKGGLGDLASPDWAKLWAQQIYNVLFVPAAPATGYVNAVNSTATQHDFDPGELILAHKTTGKTYRNQATISILANATTSNIAIAADEVGTGSNAAPFEIREKSVSPSLNGVQFLNPTSILGADEEKTAALVARARSKLGSLSPLGPKEIYDYIARTPEYSATSTPITRSKTTCNKLTGEVFVYCATASGAPSGPDLDIVNAAFYQWAEPWCVTALALAANEVVIPVSYKVWIKTSLTSAQVQTTISNALAIYFSSIPVGGVVVPPDMGALYLEALTFVIHTSVPGIQRVEVLAPTSDTMFFPYEVPILGSITSQVIFLP